MNSRIGLYSKFLIFLSVVASFSACRSSDGDFDASGTFEATEVIISAESMGQIIDFKLMEGMDVTENQVLGIIDSTQLYLKKQQLLATQQALLTRRPNMSKQIAAIEQQIITAKSERKRIQNLVNAQAANQKQLDDVNAQIAVLEKQLVASKSSIGIADNGIMGDNEALKIQVEQIEDQLKKCKICAPINGTILLKYAEQGELAVVGKPLLKLADTKNMILRAYITADQLSTIKVGQKVKVFADSGEDESKELAGTVGWVSSKSEFTPKTIQTRDERANLVYAVKINVENDGFLKIGMYGNLIFN